MYMYMNMYIHIYIYIYIYIYHYVVWSRMPKTFETRLSCDFFDACISSYVCIRMYIIYIYVINIYIYMLLVACFSPLVSLTTVFTLSSSSLVSSVSANPYR